MSTIANASEKPLFHKSGTTPDVSGALQDYYQNMVFTPVAKIIQGFQAEEIGNPINFRGVIMPFTPRELLLRSEGERAWTWWSLYSDPVLTLQVDDVVLYQSKQYRVMSRTNYSLYGYQIYSLVTDWTGSGPS